MMLLTSAWNVQDTYDATSMAVMDKLAWCCHGERQLAVQGSVMTCSGKTDCDQSYGTNDTARCHAWLQESCMTSQLCEPIAARPSLAYASTCLALTAMSNGIGKHCDCKQSASLRMRGVACRGVIARTKKLAYELKSEQKQLSAYIEERNVQHCRKGRQF